MKKIRWVMIVCIMGILLSQIATLAHADNGPEGRGDQGLYRIELYAPITTARVKPPMGQHSFTVEVVDESFFAALGWTYRRVELEIVNITGENWVYGLSDTQLFLAHKESRYINVTAGAGPNASFYSTCTLHAKMLDQPIGNSWHHKNLTFSLTVAPFHALTLELEERVFEKGQDEFFTVPLTIINQGNHEDIYSLHIDYIPRGWQFAFSSQTGFIPPKSPRTEYLYLYIPHEKIYIRQETYLVEIVLKSEFDSGIDQDSRFVIVTLQGFHLTLLQQAGVVTSTPIFLLLCALGIVAYRSRDPCYNIPRPWREEKTYLDRLEDVQRNKEKKIMKEEWLSALQYCKAEREWEQKRRRMISRQDALQQNLEDKITREWEKSWLAADTLWRRYCTRIQKKYDNEKENITRDYRGTNQWIERIYAGLNKKRDKQNLAPLHAPLLEKTHIFPLRLPPPPTKFPKPTIPQYQYDETSNEIIEPPPGAIDAIMASLKKRRVVGKAQRDKMKTICHLKYLEVTQKLCLAREKLEKDITRIKERVEIEKEKENTRYKKDQDLKKLRERFQREKKDDK